MDQELKFKTELTIHIRKRWDGGTLEFSTAGCEKLSVRRLDFQAVNNHHPSSIIHHHNNQIKNHDNDNNHHHNHNNRPPLPHHYHDNNNNNLDLLKGYPKNKKTTL